MAEAVVKIGKLDLSLEVEATPRKKDVETEGWS